MSSRQLDFFCTPIEFVAILQRYEGPFTNVILREWFPATSRQIELNTLSVDDFEPIGQQLIFVPSGDYSPGDLEQAVFDPMAVVCTVPKTKGRCLCISSLFMSSVRKDELEMMRDKIASFENLRGLFESILKKPVFGFYDRIVPSYLYSAGAKEWEEGGGVLTSVLSRVEARCYIERPPTGNELCE